MAILMICFFWILLILMVISLFCGFSYGFSGPELGRDNVNNAMGKASEMAENIKADIISEAHNHERASSERKASGRHSKPQMTELTQMPTKQDPDRKMPLQLMIRI